MIELDEFGHVAAATQAVDTVCNNYEGLQPGCFQEACVESLALRAAHDPVLQQQLVIRALMIQTAREEMFKLRVIERAGKKEDGDGESRARNTFTKSRPARSRSR